MSQSVFGTSSVTFFQTPFYENLRPECLAMAEYSCTFWFLEIFETADARFHAIGIMTQLKLFRTLEFFVAAMNLVCL